MYKYAIFDLDGTLLNTLGDLHAAVNFAMREFKFPERTMEEVRRFIGNGVVKLIERSTPDGTDAETDTKCLDVFRKYYLAHMKDMTAPYEGITEMLLTLKEKGVKTAVVSNKLHAAVEGLCEDYFPGRIDIAIGVSDESERKPSPTNVFKALDTLNAECKPLSQLSLTAQHARPPLALCAISPTLWGNHPLKEEPMQNAELCAGGDVYGDPKSYTIYIGDSEVDVWTAKNEGLRCIGVTWGFRDREELLEAGAEFIADSVDEVLRILL